ncbi:NGFI-A-binding protein homolog isoform X2 [Cephus cinctus]|uniref:NGFI-A-binding protein homolog isoform X2 n=1 Tax=Cephus cinctus TaxID=211228 RepID=A0AAJ7BH49_CEPCN|nr:NGFI-A-binding protein homolog isoform X2 [Cephus cinctus]
MGFCVLDWSSRSRTVRSGMETRVGVCTGSTEEAPRGVGTPSPVPAPISSVSGNVLTAGIATQSVVVSSPPSSQSSGHPQPHTVPRIFSRNANGTLVQTSVPQNEAELQLYRVMQRASLLGYYDTLLQMGGDDVQQLCDAGEEEFLEIMALVNMASKPLHVRRLQKALQEWLTNPALFQTPVVPPNASCKTSVVGFPCVSPRPQGNPAGFTTTSQTPTPYAATHVPLTPLPCRSASPVVPPTTVNAPVASSTFRHSPSPNAPLPYTASNSPGVLQVGTCESSCGSGTTPSPSGGGAPASPTQPTPTLLQSQVQRLAEAAERLAATLRPLDPKPHNVKKKICKNLEMVMAMPDSDPRRMEEIRKYAAIYGRFDCKRKPEKPLTLHEAELDLRCSGTDINSSSIRRHESSSPVWRKNSNGIFSTSVEEISDSDSQFSFSNEESSSLHDTNEAEADNTDKESDFNLKVIASRGDNIIAVANPALMECNAALPIKEEPTDEKPTL